MDRPGLPALGDLHPRPGPGFSRNPPHHSAALFPRASRCARFRPASGGRGHEPTAATFAASSARLSTASWALPTSVTAGTPRSRLTRRRLLSLDFVLDHPELPWLPTEPEKVSCFERLGIDPELLPKRIYRPDGPTGESAIFTSRCLSPSSRTGPPSPTSTPAWEPIQRVAILGSSSPPIFGRKLRHSGRRVEVVAVAWEQHLLDRAEQCSHSPGRGRRRDRGRDSNSSPFAKRFRKSRLGQAVERYGGLNAALDRR